MLAFCFKRVCTFQIYKDCFEIYVRRTGAAMQVVRRCCLMGRGAEAKRQGMRGTESIDMVSDAIFVD